MHRPAPILSSVQILAHRPPKNAVDLRRPYAFFVEQERTADGRIEDVATVFLTNRECRFRCLFCDLWKNTTDDATPPGAIPGQLDWAFSRLPPARHVKLYNSGNFFDTASIPQSDHRAIAERVRSFQTVIVENHPQLCTDTCIRFRELVETRFEMALGLETIHPEILALLNKRMTVGDFDRAAEFLLRNGIALRAFILLRPPFLTEEEGREWALKSIEHAFAAGVGCCAVIPVRAGNGIMDRLRREGAFEPPRLSSLEATLEAGLRLGRGRVFADLWDVDQLAACPDCQPQRIERLKSMNLSQTILPRTHCHCGGGL